MTSFAGASAALPTTLGNPGGWLRLFVQQRFFPIFAMLFGAGFSLLFASAARRSARPRTALLALLALLAAGLVHQVWRPGEALAVYAAGLLVLLPSTWLPRWAVAGGAAALVVAALVLADGGMALVPGTVLLGSALVRFGVVERFDRPGPHVEPYFLAPLAAAAAALVWQLRDLAESGFTTSSAVTGLLLAGVYTTGILLAMPTRGRAGPAHGVRTAGQVVPDELRCRDARHCRRGAGAGPVSQPLVEAGTPGGRGGSLRSVGVVNRVAALLPAGPLEYLWRWATGGNRGALRPPSPAGRRVGTAGAIAAALLATGCTAATGTAGPPKTTPTDTVPIVVLAATDTPRPHRAADPGDVLLPDEGRRSRSPEFTDWATDEHVDRAWLLDPCRPTAYPTDARRTAFRTVTRTGPEVVEGRQLAVYSSSTTAAETVASFRRALVACRSGGRAAEGNRWQWVMADAPELGTEGFVAASTVSGPGFSATGDRIAVTRRGSAVFLSYLRSEYYTAQLDDGTRVARDVARAFLASVGGR